MKTQELERTRQVTFVYNDPDLAGAAIDEPITFEYIPGPSYHVALDDEVGEGPDVGRFYDPTTGEWSSQDPMGFEPGDTNLFRYHVPSQQP